MRPNPRPGLGPAEPGPGGGRAHAAAGPGGGRRRGAAGRAGAARSDTVIPDCRWLPLFSGLHSNLALIVAIFSRSFSFHATI
jgi:hypothetical protein